MGFDAVNTMEAMLDARHPRKMEAAAWAAESLGVSSAGSDRDLWRRAADFGIQGLTIPREFGGTAASAVDAMLTFEGVGLGAPDNGIAFALSSQVFPAQMTLARFGDDDQRARWLPGLADGSIIGAFAMSEPLAGSDSGAITSTALRQADGSFRLDGVKDWVTLGPVCDEVIVFASTDPSRGRWGLSAFVVDASADGVERSAAHTKLGLDSCPFGRLTFDGCRVEPDRLLGGLGAGASIFAAAVEAERAFLYAPQLGAMERLIEQTIERVRRRQQFGRPIGGFQAVSHRVVDMKVRHDASRLLLYRVAAYVDRGESVRMTSSIAKLQAAEAAVATAMDAVRIHGAEGYTVAGGVERELRDAVGGLTYAGTSEIQRNIVASLLHLDRPIDSSDTKEGTTDR
jgi:alkylation response protein AidB-like acyl-CoA dehydrogenase